VLGKYVHKIFIWFGFIEHMPIQYLVYESQVWGKGSFIGETGLMQIFQRFTGRKGRLKKQDTTFRKL